MSFNTQNILAAINTSGVAKTSHFEVEITGPGDVGTERDMLYRASDAEIPGRTITTTEHKFTNYGPINKVAYGQLYGDMTVTLLMSEDLREKEYFELWQEKMVNTGAFEVGGAKTVGSPHNTKYFDDYVGTVTVRQYGQAGDLRAIHTLVQAYPIGISPIAMSWNDDETVKMNVTFAYKYYKTVFNKQDQPGLGFGFSINVGRGGVTGSARFPNFGTIIGGLGNVQATVGGANKIAAKIRNFL